MKWLKNFFMLVTVLAFCACATTGPGSSDIDKNDPEYQKGYALGVETAHRDKRHINCANGAFGLKWAKKRQKEPGVADQSELFRSGFYEGYADTWNENMGVICE